MSNQGEAQVIKTQAKVSFTFQDTHHFVWRGLGQMKSNEREILAAGEAYKDIFWLTPGSKEGNLESSGVSAKEALISALAAPYGRCIRWRRAEKGVHG